MGTKNRLILGECSAKIKEIADNSVDAIITDPPYGLSFMGKKWDYDVPNVDVWREALRVLKPGGHLLSFGGTRTYHRLVVNIEDAGFEIRDQIQWIYGSGFPKSLDVSKAIDKAAGAEREVLRLETHPIRAKGRGYGRDENGHVINKGLLTANLGMHDIPVTAPSTDLAKQWQGWGTALKPANEPICVARKPLEGTVASNVAKWGTGAINIDASRIEGTKRSPEFKDPQSELGYHGGSSNKNLVGWDASQGRWPANVIFDEEAGRILDEQSGVSTARGGNPKTQSTIGFGDENGRVEASRIVRNDSGGASRFFYCAKASKSERNAGLEFTDNPLTKHDARPVDWESADWKSRGGNHHPTVKPLKLMEYLVRLVTPPNGTVLDPFMGSGTTGIAAKRLGFNFIGIEMNEEYFQIAEKRFGNG